MSPAHNDQAQEMEHLQSPEWELRILLSLILIPDEIFPLCIEKNLSAGDFYVPAHGIIFNTITLIIREGQKPDRTIIERRLLEGGKLDHAGVASAIDKMHTATAELALADNSCEVGLDINSIRESALRRKGCAIAATFGRGASDENEPWKRVIHEAHRAIEELAQETGFESNGSEQLAAVRFDLNNPPLHSQPIFMLGDAKIATAGNLVGIQAQPKAGKTALIGGFLAATMDPTGDTLGIISQNPRGHAVIHFDTEQSRADHHSLIRLVLHRAGRSEPPPWLRSYSIAGFTLEDRKAALFFELERANNACGGIHSVILDGLADFVANPNDPGETFALLDKLHQAAISNNTTIVNVLHENPGSDKGKTRGHLGSHLERKAETNLRLAKDANGISVIFAERARHAHIPREKGPCFKWCDVTKMHVTTITAADSRADAKRDTLRDLVTEIFRDMPASASISWSEIHKRIEELCGIKREGARRRFKELLKWKLIHKVGTSYFRSI